MCGPGEPYRSSYGHVGLRRLRQRHGGPVALDELEEPVPCTLAVRGARAWRSVPTGGAQPDRAGGGCQDESVASFGRSDTVELDPRTPGPIRRLDVYVALGTTGFACLAYAVTLVTNGVPPRGWAVVLFAAVPLLAAVALVVMGSRARAEKDPALQWVSAGLLVT